MREPRDDTPLTGELRERVLTLWHLTLRQEMTTCDALEVLARDLARVEAERDEAIKDLARKRHLNDELVAALAVATTPDTFGHTDGGDPELFADLQDHDMDPTDVCRVWTSRSCGDRWLARVVLTTDSDGDVDETVVRAFTTEAAAASASTAREVMP